jgi:hypothetical protein
MNGSSLGISKKKAKIYFAFLCKKPVFHEFSPAASGSGGE